MHDNTSHGPPPCASPCASATRIRALLDLSGLSGMVFLSKAIPEHLYPLVRQLLDAPTEEDFQRIRNEAVDEYASLSTPDKRELVRRLSTILPADALAELGRLLDDTPTRHDERDQVKLDLEANTIRLLTALPPFLAPLLLGLGSDLADRFVAVFEAQTDEALELAWDEFNAALEANPDRASAALENRDVRFMLAALRRIVKTDGLTTSIHQAIRPSSKLGLRWRGRAYAAVFLAARLDWQRHHSLRQQARSLHCLPTRSTDSHLKSATTCIPAFARYKPNFRSRDGFDKAPHFLVQQTATTVDLEAVVNEAGRVVEQKIAATCANLDTAAAVRAQSSASSGWGAPTKARRRIRIEPGMHRSGAQRRHL